RTAGMRSKLTLTGKLLHRPSFPLGRPPGAMRPRRRRIVTWPGWRYRGQILPQRLRYFGRTTAFCKARDLEDPHATVQRHRDDIARAHRLARGLDAPAVEPHVAGGGERCGGGAGAYHPRVPKPLVDALAIQVQRRSLALASSCSLRAASLA